MKSILNTKYERLYNSQHGKNSQFIEKSVKNISSKVLSDAEKSVLGKGLKFNTQHTKKDTISFVANVDSGIDKISTLTEADKNLLKERVASSIAGVKNKSNLKI